MARRSQVALESGETDGAAKAVPVIARGPVTAAAATTRRAAGGGTGRTAWRGDQTFGGSGSSRGSAGRGPGGRPVRRPGTDAGERDDVAGTVTEPRPSVTRRDEAPRGMRGEWSSHRVGWRTV